MTYDNTAARQGQCYDNIPQEMRTLNKWVNFAFEERNGKKTKVPYNPAAADSKAKSNDKSTWSSFELAVEKTDYAYDGIGFMFSNSPYVGIDIDHCVENGVISEFAQSIIQTLSSYTEFSPSDTGIHIICRGTAPPGGNKNTKQGIEMYSSGRYFTMTGNILPGYERIADAQAAIDEIHKQYLLKKPASIPNKAGNTSLSVDSIITLALNSKQGQAFQKLYKGEWQDGYQSQSEADLAFCNWLAFWTGRNAEKMDAIYRKSGLFRDKWDEVHGHDTYGNITIAKAIADCKEVYELYAFPEIDQNKDLTKLAYFKYTDAGNAERLQYVYGDKIRYCTPYKSWFLYNGKCWQEGTASEVLLMSLSTMRQSTQLANSDIFSSKEQKETFENFCRRSESYSSLKAMTALAATLLPVRPEELDADHWLLNCQNGMVDLRTGKLLPPDRKSMLTKICRAEYYEGYTSPLWERVMREIVPDDDLRHYLQKFVGYSITGSIREEKFMVLYGRGGGGKGTFIESIGHVLGEYADVIPVEILLSSRSDRDGNEPSPELAKLPAVRMAMSSESDKGRYFNAAKIKLITGGDKITCRRLRCDPFTYSPNFKLLLSSNYLPKVSDAMDEGVFRRIVIAPFDAIFDGKRDVTLKEQLKAPDNMNAILAWCVDGCLLWQREGLENEPARITAIRNQYRDDCDILGQFIEEHCITGRDCRVSVTELHHRFSEWAQECGLRGKYTRNGFGDMMTTRGYIKHKPNKIWVWEGLSLKYG